MAKPCVCLGGVRGKAVAARWRATGGAGHKCHNERADWRKKISDADANWQTTTFEPWNVDLVGSGMIGRLEGQAAGELPQSPKSVVGCGSGRQWASRESCPWRRRADDLCGACILHAKVFGMVEGAERL